jgi:hypothetical protein
MPENTSVSDFCGTFKALETPLTGTNNIKKIIKVYNIKFGAVAGTKWKLTYFFNDYKLSLAVFFNLTSVSCPDGQTISASPRNYM